VTWCREEWTARREAHVTRAQRLLAPVLERRRTGERHPIEDFLFDYYRLRPSDLLEWHPGLGVLLEDADELAGRRWYAVRDGGVTVDVDAFMERRRGIVTFTHELLTAVDTRPAHYGCFGLHEWAMVHGLQQHEVRHADLPLRFAPERIAEVVESHGVRCSHFDAYRFFTDSARGLNERVLSRDDQVASDQPGCLHVGMDLYKWAGKLLPLTSSELLLDTYELACDIRLLDMRASAYDVRAYGHEPVAVETPRGRADYVRQQREFTERAAPLRARLLAVTTQMVGA